MDFYKIKTFPLPYRETLYGIKQWKYIYTICIEELERFMKDRDIISIYKEEHTTSATYQVTIFYNIANSLRYTGTHLEVRNSLIYLDVKPFLFKDFKGVLKSVNKLGWTESNYTTLREQRIPEFFELKEKYQNLRIEVEDELKSLESFYPEDNKYRKVFEINRNRIQGLINIILGIEELYSNGYVEFVNDIFLKLQKTEEELKEDKKDNKK